MKFKIGDEVEAFGNKGTVHSYSKNELVMYVKFDDFDSLVNFRPDGRLYSWNKKPSVKLIKTFKPLQVKVNVDETTGENYFILEQFKPLFKAKTFKSIDKYNLQHLDNGVISVAFFDKNDNPIKPDKEKVDK